LRDRLVVHPQRGRFGRFDPFPNPLRGAAGEGELAGQNAVEKTAEAEDVRRRAEAHAVGVLRRLEVRQAADPRAGGRHGKHRGADTVVQQHARTVRRDQDVVGLEVEVKHVRRVRGREPASECEQQLDARIDAVNRLALDVGGNQHLADASLEGDDAGFLQHGRLLGIPHRAIDHFFRERVAGELEHDLAATRFVPGEIRFAQRTAAELPLESIAVERRPRGLQFGGEFEFLLHRRGLCVGDEFRLLRLREELLNGGGLRSGGDLFLDQRRLRIQRECVLDLFGQRGRRIRIRLRFDQLLQQRRLILRFRNGRFLLDLCLRREFVPRRLVALLHFLIEALEHLVAKRVRDPVEVFLQIRLPPFVDQTQEFSDIGLGIGPDIRPGGRTDFARHNSPTGGNLSLARSEARRAYPAAPSIETAEGLKAQAHSFR
jgi:hypothetical protein